MDSGVKTMEEELRDFIAKANLDAVDVIEKAIAIAACDQPEKFVAESGLLIAMLFRYSRRISWTNTNITYTDNVDVDDSSQKSSDENDDGGLSDPLSPSPESDQEEDDVMEEEQDMVHQRDAVEIAVAKKVIKISKIISRQTISERILLELLKILRFEPMTVAILKVTNIEMVVDKFRDHESEAISRVANVMCTNWTNVRNEWRLACYGAGIIPDLNNIHLDVSMDDVTVDDDDEGQEFERIPPMIIKLKGGRVIKPAKNEDIKDEKPQLKVEDENEPVVMFDPSEQDKLNEPILSNDVSVLKKELPLQKVEEEEKLIPSKKSAVVHKKELIPSKDELNKPIVSSNDVSIQIQKEELPKKNLNKPIPLKDVSVQKKELPQQKVDDKKFTPSNDKLRSVENQLKEKIADSKRKLQEGYQVEAKKKRKIITVTNIKDLPNGGRLPCSNPRNYWKQKPQQGRLGTFYGRI